MTIKHFRFKTIFTVIALLLASMSMGLSFCHLLEMPVRLQYEPALWSRVTNIEGTYQFFGPLLGAWIDGGAWITAVVLCILVRQQTSTFLWTLAGAVLLIAAQAVWWLYVFPVNNEMVSWMPDTLPNNFDALHTQWEHGHAAMAVIKIIGLTSLIISVVITPKPVSNLN